MNTYQQILTKYWGFSSFRPLQEEVIKEIANNRDTLALMATGAGKSITFQVPALLREGFCLVITPLISLMNDQVNRLTKLNIKAVSIHSGMSTEEIKIAMDYCIYGDYKFLYCSPERLGTDLFIYRIQKAKVNLIVVDEAHCISQWGYDFRPSYLQIANIRKYFPNVPVLALTATATSDVVDDIQKKLLFKTPNVLKASFERKNLVYTVIESENKEKLLVDIAKKTKGSGIIYVKTRKKTREIADILKKNQLSADYFHAGLDTEVKKSKQQEWTNDKTKIMVATNAFGMGIDKSNVRYIVHYDIPDSLEEYFQEAGRAGRDDNESLAMLMYDNNDIQQLRSRIDRKYPDIKTIKNIYEALFNYYQIPLGGGKGLVMDFNIADFAQRYNIEILVAYNSLKLLQGEGLLELTDEIDNPSRIHFIVNRDDLYRFQISNVQFDNFIKLLLRTYTGIFSDYVKIDETLLARRANISRDDVYNYLCKLSNLKIINYIPQKKTPLIILTEQRLESNAIIFSPDKYFSLKEKYIARLNAVMMYVTSSSKCRNQILMAYFNEKNADRCGQCDVCKKRNKLNLSKYEFDIILKDIKEKLQHKSISLYELAESSSFDKEKVVKVIQWLTDNKKIRITDEQLLTWHS